MGRRRLDKGDLAANREYFRNYCDFFLRMGHDTMSFERGIASIMPASGYLAMVDAVREWRGEGPVGVS